MVHVEIHAGDVGRELMQRPVTTPVPAQGSNAFECTIEVVDFDATHARIPANGGRVALPKRPRTCLAWQGYFLDPEGIAFGTHQPDPHAS